MRVCAEQNGNAVKLGSGYRNPKAEADVSRVNHDGIVRVGSDQPPQARIHQPEKAPQAGPKRPVGHADPGITFEQRNIPFHFDAKLRVERGFGTLHTTVSHLDIESRVLRHLAEYGRSVLHRMGTDEQDAIAVFRHGRD